MTTSAIVLFGYVAWSLALSFGLLGSRVAAQITEGRLANSFAQDGSDLGPFGHRATRAFGNSIEWLAVPAALLLVAISTGNTAITDTLAPVALGGRMAQSITHLISTSPTAVMIRGAFLGVQVVCWIVWVVGFANVSFA